MLRGSTTQYLKSEDLEQTCMTINVKLGKLCIFFVPQIIYFQNEDNNKTVRVLQELFQVKGIRKVSQRHI